MASTQQPMGQIAASSLGALFGNISQLGRKAQEIAGEFARMSEENLGAGARAAERMRDAKSIDEVASIQTDLMRETYECSASHYRKIAEIAVSTPPEIARNYQNLVSAVSQTGQEAVNRAARTTRQFGEEAAKATERTVGAMEGAARRG